MHRIKNIYWAIASFSAVALTLGFCYFFTGSSQLDAFYSVSDIEKSQGPMVVSEPVGSTISKQLDTSARPADRPATVLSLNWAKLTIHTSLNSIYDAALKSNDPDDRNVLIQLGAICTRNFKSKVTVEDMAFGNESHINNNSVLKETETARTKLQQFCQSGDTNSAFAEWQKKGIKSSPLYRSMLRGSSNDTSAEYYQGLTQVLSNPEKYSLYFDLWLAHDAKRMVLKEMAATPGQLIFIQDELARRLTSDTDPESIRLLDRCATQFVCPSSISLSSEQRQKAIEVSEILVTRIRRQQWVELFAR